MEFFVKNLVFSIWQTKTSQVRSEGLEFADFANSSPYCSGLGWRQKKYRPLRNSQLNYQDDIQWHNRTRRRDSIDLSGWVSKSTYILLIPIIILVDYA